MASAASASASLRQMLLEVQEKTFAEHGLQGRFSYWWFIYRNLIRGKLLRDLNELVNLLIRLYKRAISRSGRTAQVASEGGESPCSFLDGVAVVAAAGIALYFISVGVADGGDVGEVEGGEGGYGGGDDNDDEAVVWLFHGQAMAEQFFVYRSSSGSYFVWFPPTNTTFRLSEQPHPIGPPLPPGNHGFAAERYTVVNPSGVIPLAGKLWTADHGIGLLACVALASEQSEGEGCETSAGAASHVVVRRCCVVRMSSGKMQRVQNAADAATHTNPERLVFDDINSIAGKPWTPDLYYDHGLLSCASFINKLDIECEMNADDDEGDRAKPRYMKKNAAATPSVRSASVHALVDPKEGDIVNIHQIITSQISSEVTVILQTPRCSCLPHFCDSRVQAAIALQTYHGSENFDGQADYSLGTRQMPKSPLLTAY